MPGEQTSDPDIVKLNTNACPYGPSPTVLDAIRKVTDRSLRLYPDPKASSLLDAIAATIGLSSDHVFVGNGSDEIELMG
jgi:histidinol-phosphate aminotransferase